MGFIGMEKADDRINRKFCGMCILSEIKSMYVDTLACVRVKGVRVINVFRKRSFELHAMTKAKMKGNGGIS